MRFATSVDMSPVGHTGSRMMISFLLPVEHHRHDRNLSRFGDSVEPGSPARHATARPLRREGENEFRLAS